MKETLHTTRHQLIEKELARDSELQQLLSEEQQASLHQQRREDREQRAAKTSKFLRQFAYLSASIAKADQLTVFEGLPRGKDEVLMRIKDEHETIAIAGWDFYRNPLTLSPAVSHRLRSTLVDYKLFHPSGGGHFCGGFHPDFCVQWQDGENSYYALVCLGCFEIEYVLPEGKTKFDYSPAAWKAFARIAVRTFTHHKEVIVKLDKTIGR